MMPAYTCCFLCMSNDVTWDWRGILSEVVCRLHELSQVPCAIVCDSCLIFENCNSVLAVVGMDCLLFTLSRIESHFVFLRTFQGGQCCNRCLNNNGALTGLSCCAAYRSA